MKKEFVYFVTLIIQVTKTQNVKGVDMKTQQITAFQEIQKNAKNAHEAKELTLTSCSIKNKNFRVIGYTITELTQSIFEEDTKIKKEIGGESC